MSVKYNYMCQSGWFNMSSGKGKFHMNTVCCHLYNALKPTEQF